MNLWSWAEAHPFLSFLLMALALDGAIKLSGKLLRTINICVRGWPTNPNLDADGDLFIEDDEDSDEMAHSHSGNAPVSGSARR